MLLKIFTVGVLKALSALITFFVIISVTRALGDDEAGLFLLGFSLLTISSVFFKLGLDNIVLREIGSRGISYSSQIILNLALTWVAIIVTPISFLIFIYSDIISYYLFNKPLFSQSLKYFSLSWILKV